MASCSAPLRCSWGKEWVHRRLRRQLIKGVRKYIENRKAMKTSHMIIETKEILMQEKSQTQENSK